MYRIKFNGLPQPDGPMYISEAGAKAENPMHEIMTCDREKAAKFNDGAELELVLAKLGDGLLMFNLEYQRDW